MFYGHMRPAAGLSAMPSSPQPCLGLDSAIGQGCGLRSTVAPGLAGPQTVLPDQMVLPALLCIQVGPEAVP